MNLAKLVNEAIAGERERIAREDARTIAILERAAQMAPHAVRAGLDPERKAVQDVLFQIAALEYDGRVSR